VIEQIASGLLFFVFEQAGDQSKEAKESRKNCIIGLITE